MGCLDCGRQPTERVIREEPIVKPGGNLLFQKLAPSLPGYTHSVDNPKLLIQDNVPCAHRITLPILQRTGGYSILNQCNHVKCEMRGMDVNTEICTACKLRDLT
jgi:hypothetical protein